jgi:hypothetical protein
MMHQLQELEAIGNALFTKWGGVNQQFLTKTSRQMGIFGPEIGSSPFSLLCGKENSEDHDFHIDTEFCCCGVGTTALKKLFQHKSLRVCTGQCLLTSAN